MARHNPIDYIFDHLKEQGRKVKLTLEGGFGKEAERIPHPRHAIFENRGTYFKPQWDRIVKERGWEPLKIFYINGDSSLAEVVQSATDKYLGLETEAEPEF